MTTEQPQNQPLHDNQLLHTLQALRNGDLPVQMPAATSATTDEVATINALSNLLGVLVSEVTRITREIGTEGRFGGQAEVEGVGDTGIWKDITVNLNTMSANLTNQLRDMNNVTRAAINGDFSRQVTVDAQHEMLELKNNINALLDKLNADNSSGNK